MLRGAMVQIGAVHLDILISIVASLTNVKKRLSQAILIPPPPAPSPIVDWQIPPRIPTSARYAYCFRVLARIRSWRRLGPITCKAFDTRRGHAPVFMVARVPVGVVGGSSGTLRLIGVGFASVSPQLATMVVSITSGLPACCSGVGLVYWFSLVDGIKPFRAMSRTLHHLLAYRHKPSGKRSHI